MNMGNPPMNMGANVPCVNLPPGLSQQMCLSLGIEPEHITNQVFVANLDYKVNGRKLTEIFKMAGNVTSVDVKEDKEGNSRGMAVVKFEHAIEAVQAISMFHNQVLYDRVLTVKMDKHGDIGSQQLPNKLPSGLKSIGLGLGQGGQPVSATQLTQGNSLMNNTSMGAMGSNMGGMGAMGGMGGMNTNAMTSNLGGMGLNMPNLAGSGGMASSMGGMGGMGSSGVSMGGSLGGNTSGFDSMGSMGMGDMSTSMGGLSSSSLGGSMSGLDAFSGASNLGGAGRSGSGLMGSSSSAPIGGSSMTSRLSTGGSGAGGMFEETCTVFVRNLPFSVTWQNLRDQFKECGDVKFAELKTDEQGRSKGYGTVRFAVPEEARRAVNLMNGFRMQGRQIEVRLNKV